MKIEWVDSHVVLFSVIRLERLAVLVTTAQLREFLVRFESDAERVGVRRWSAWFHLYVVPIYAEDVGQLCDMDLAVQFIGETKGRTSGEVDGPGVCWYMAERGKGRHGRSHHISSR